MAASSALDFFELFYQPLIKLLPFQDRKFISDLHGQDLIPTDVSASIESFATCEEKASYFLDMVVKSDLMNGDCTSFNKLAVVMNRSKYDELQHIAAIMMSSSALSLTKDRGKM